MKIAVIIFAVLVMLGGGAVSIMKWLQMGPFEPTVEELAEQQESSEPPRFIDMDQLTIPIFQGEKVVANVQIQLKLETLGEDNESKLLRLLPRLSDAFWRDLYGFIPRLLRKERQIDATVIKERLRLIGDKVVGKGVINNVLVQSLTNSPSR
ncbi:MAG: hypothetical protein QF511_05755 [Rhodospirillales bacterium]|jgi:hypothetical protein|nr:hypothetical protein [Rhodospirillales bacterium]HIJ43157.1 hypothetical protein [Rhodospirillaceae bacterium]MDP7098010.1 hypothetical protein [Rhodospirillales bacterium]MDP7215042.1 hypothetical protein [Rhodospirillales bacterium]HIJ45152.1 hypothetical protein [Rhodospirillaceae bacterium]